VAELIITVSGSAIAWSRAATFVVSPLAAAHLSDDHRTRVDADPHRERGRFRTLADRIHDPEARAHGALGVVLVRPGPAEVGEDPVAQILRHVALEARDHFARRGVIALHERAPVLRVHAGREARRVDQVAEEHSQLAALGSLGLLDRPAQRRLRKLRRGSRRSLGSLRLLHPREHLPLPDGHLLDFRQLLDDQLEGVVVEGELAA
jgi:hypothetical protein